MGIIQIAMIGVGATALILMVRQSKNEYALYISLTAALLILFFSMDRLQIVVETIEKMEALIQVDRGIIKILVKLIGITYVAEFAAGICRDAGITSLAGQIELFARFSIMAVSVPVLLELMESVEQMLGG